VSRLARAAVWLAAAAALGACRGQPSAKQPLHVVPDMDWQPRFQPQGATTLWEDGRSMRPLVVGTVAQGHLRDDEGFYRGMVGTQYLARAPITVDERTLRRGQERYDIYCAVCHDRSGAGQGMAVKRGYPLPISLTSDRVLGMPDGLLFWTISNGIRNMPAYRKQIPVEDRWAIVAWVRVLGRSQHAQVADVPPEKKDQIEPEVPPQ
jgi:mono/diheme cytochrome c family protein